MAKLTTIEGIGPALAEKLKEAGVRSVEALLKQGGTRQGRAALAAATGIDASRLSRFVNHADLMRVKGVGGEYAELLEAAGVDSLPELAQRNAGNLATRMKTANDDKKLVRSVPTAARVEAWVAQAKSLPRAVHH